jgi:hypothetical protein
MRYTVRESYVNVIGQIWMPSTTGATRYNLTGYDIENARGDDGQITRESVQVWLDGHAGDFASVTDFEASIEDGDSTVGIPWADEESELTYNGCMFPDED